MRQRSGLASLIPFSLAMLVAALARPTTASACSYNSGLRLVPLGVGGDGIYMARISHTRGHDPKDLMRSRYRMRASLSVLPEPRQRDAEGTASATSSVTYESPGRAFDELVTAVRGRLPTPLRARARLKRVVECRYGRRCGGFLVSPRGIRHQNDVQWTPVTFPGDFKHFYSGLTYEEVQPRIRSVHTYYAAGTRISVVTLGSWSQQGEEGFRVVRSPTQPLYYSPLHHGMLFDVVLVR